MNILAKIVTVIVFVLVLISFMTPPINSGPPSVEVQCGNNLKNIALAMRSYHDDYGTFPPVKGPDGRPAHSWRVLLLPYLDENPMYRQYRFDEPWNGPNNSKLADKMPRVYRCPGFAKYGSGPQSKRQLTNYVVVIAADGVFSHDATATLDDITDAPEHTLLVVETGQHAVHWMQPEDVTEPEMAAELRAVLNGAPSNHRKRLWCAFADAGTKLLSSTTDSDRFHALVTRNGSEEVEER